MRNPSDNSQMTLLLVQDLKTARNAVSQVRPTRAMCQPLSTEDAALKRGRDLSGIAYFLFKTWRETRSVLSS